MVTPTRRLSCVVLTALVAATLVSLAAPPPASAGTDPVLTLDREPYDGYEGPGDTVRLSLYEADLPAFAEVTSARLRTTSDPVGISVTLRRPTASTASSSGGQHSPLGRATTAVTGST